MDVDVSTAIVIDRPRDQVADYASDPDHVTSWYANITSVEWRSPRPVSVGSRIAFNARFLGRSLVYTYEVTEIVPGARFQMRTSEGPFPMETTYTWSDATASDGPGGATEMMLRNRGTPTGFSRLLAPLMVPAIRRANGKDLARLKAILEADPPPAP
jgi:uncharacterized membrane protein